jgi:anti-sigma factor RsiW
MTIDPHLLSGAYALDALDPEERAAFEQHLAECPQCAEEVRGFEETAARLGDAASVPVPAHLRDAVLDQVRRTPQERPVVVPLRRRRRLAGSLAAAAVAAAVLGGVTVYAVDQHRDAEQLRVQRSELDEVLGAPDATFATAPVKGGGIVKVVVSPRTDRAVMVLSQLPALDEEHDYQMWTQVGDEMVSAGVVPRDEHGRVGTHLMEGVDEVSAVALTVEPAGGSDGPSSDPIALVETPGA